ncbi:helix-turn-helix domain-containing protein [Rhizobium sp. FKY42]|uniref:helix-turn-helix domain-containing protein n=1 Tax=Rhizobium sp. FKY42 TaxID=2562310 RepID=UPI001FEF1401|nr:helix-turn-helix domain-containing protein [Rhizobium sp. FKY42]
MPNASPITEYRTAQTPRMTLEAFGKLFDPPVLPSTVMRWENGRLTPERALEIEKLTGISRSRLLPKYWPEPAPVVEAAE